MNRVEPNNERVLKMQVVQLCAACRGTYRGGMLRPEHFRWGGDCKVRGEYRACRQQRRWKAAGRQATVHCVKAGLQLACRCTYECMED